MDAFERFAQEEVAWSALREMGPSLARDAAQVLDDMPEVPLDGLAGLIALPGSAAWPRLRDIAAVARGEVPSASLPVAGLLPRSEVEAYAGPRFATFCEEHAASGTGRVPVVVTTKDGLQFGAFPLSGGSGATSTEVLGHEV